MYRPLSRYTILPEFFDVVIVGEFLSGTGSWTGILTTRMSSLAFISDRYPNPRD